jgi:hypothetical protein
MKLFIGVMNLGIIGVSMDTRKIDEDFDSEEIIGTEDRIFSSYSGEWYWQARGALDCVGPFASRMAAITDYESK